MYIFTMQIYVFKKEVLVSLIENERLFFHKILKNNIVSQYAK